MGIETGIGVKIASYQIKFRGKVEIFTEFFLQYVTLIIYFFNDGVRSWIDRASVGCLHHWLVVPL